MKTLPPQWAATKLADHLREPIRNGYSPRCPENPTGTWILSLSAVTHSGFDKTGIKPAPLGDEKVAKNLLSAGDIVVSRSNTPDRVGLAGIYEGNPTPCSYPDLLMRVRLTDNLDPKFLLAHLLSDVGRRFFTENARGSSGSMVKIDRSILESFSIPTPPIEEQRAIASALSDMDALLAKLDQLIAKKRDIKQAAMQELLKGRRRLPGFPAKWNQIKLGDVADIRTGKKNNEDKSPAGKHPFFVRSQTVERIDSYSFDGEAILIPGEGGIGTIIHYINGKFDYHQRVYKISNFVESISCKYVYYWMMMGFSSHAAANSVKATVDSLRLPTFKAFTFFAPSIEEQISIAAVISDIDTEITALEARREKTRLIKQGMMQELLSGRVRLI